MADRTAPVNTRSKRKERKRKYTEMVKESKRISPPSTNTQNSDCDSDGSDNNNHKNKDGSPSTTNQTTSTPNTDELNPSDLNTPSPSKPDHPDTEADTNGASISSHHRANLDEFTFMLRGIRIKDGDDTASKQFAVHLLKNLLVLGHWLAVDDNLALVLDDTATPTHPHPPRHMCALMSDLRVLSRLYAHDNAIVAAVLGVLVHLISTQSSSTILQCGDVAVNILLRFIQKDSVSVNHVVSALRLSFSAASVSAAANCNHKSSRNNRRSNPQKHSQKQGAKIATDLLSLFASARVSHADGALDLNAVYCASFAYLASSALIQLVSSALQGLTDHQTANANATQIVRYVCHSTVMYKLACIAQLNCVALEASHQIRNTQQLQSIENEFELLELITRHLASVKANCRQQTSNCNSGDSDPNIEKQALLKILDCIGLLLRFSESVYLRRRNSRPPSKSVSPMDCCVDDAYDEDDVELRPEDGECHEWRIERLLLLTLKVLANVTNAWNVTLKPDTVRSIFFLFTHFNAKAQAQTQSPFHYQSLLLILGVLINCCEKNKNFRNRINEYRMDELTVIEYLIRCFSDLRLRIIEIENKNSEALEPASGEEEEDGKHSVAKQYMQHKVITYYICLLLGFLLQNTEHFKYIGLRMNDLSVIAYTLQQFFQFQQELNPNHHTLVVIVQVIKIVNLRNETLKNIAGKQRQKVMEKEEAQHKN